MKTKNQSGQIMIIAVVFLAVLVYLASVFFGGIQGFLFGSRSNFGREKALQIAEAGVDKAIFELNQSAGAYSGETGAVCSSCQGEFIISVSGTGNQRTIESTGYFPSSANPQLTKKVKVKAEVTTTTVSFYYGLQAGIGGIEMENSSRVEGIGGSAGNVYSNGSIIETVGNGATITGDAWVAVDPNETTDVQHTAQTANFNFRDSSSRRDAAQSFIPNSTKALNKIQLYIRKQGSPPDATVHILPDNGGSPGTSPIATKTDNLSASGTFAWVDVTFDSNPQLSAGQKYWIVIDTSSQSGSNYWVWGSSSDSSYSDGTAKYCDNYSSCTWSLENADADFKIITGNVITKIDDVEVGGDAHANTINDAIVNGECRYQIKSGTTLCGSDFSGSSDPEYKDFAIGTAEINSWKQEAENGGTTSGDYVLSGSSVADLGPKKIVGNMKLENSSTLTVTGTIYVTGNIDLQNSCVIRLDPGFGSSSAVIIADGKIIVGNSCTILGSGSSDSYIMLLSNYTGQTSADPAIDLANSSAGAIYFTPNGAIKMGNSVTLRMATGAKLILQNSATVQYEEGLQSTSFSSGPGGSWQVKSRTWQILPF